MANPTKGWDRIPVYGWYFGPGEVPVTGQVHFDLADRVVTVTGDAIYPKDMRITAVIGDPDSQDAAVKSLVRQAYRDYYEALDELPHMSGAFNGVAFDAWWDGRLPAAIFASFYAGDDPNIVQGDEPYQVKVTESLTNGDGQIYYITPLLSQLDTEIPGINLGLIIVPPGSPTAPAPMYAKGVPGGVAALNLNGEVVDADGNPVTGGGLDEEALADYLSTHPQDLADGAVTATKIGTDAVTTAKIATGAVTAGELADGAVTDAKLGTGRFALTAARQSKLDGLPADAQSASQVDSRADLRIAAQKDAANGVAGLDGAGKLSSTVLPPLAIGETFTVASQSAMLALTAQRGDIAIRTDLDPDGVFILTSDVPSTLANWVQITAPGAVVTVAGRSGAVVLARGDVGLGSVDNVRQVPLAAERLRIPASAANTWPSRTGSLPSGFTGPADWDHSAYGAVTVLPSDIVTGDWVTDLAP